MTKERKSIRMLGAALLVAVGLGAAAPASAAGLAAGRPAEAAQATQGAQAVDWRKRHDRRQGWNDRRDWRHDRHHGRHWRRHPWPPFYGYYYYRPHHRGHGWR